MQVRKKGKNIIDIIPEKPCREVFNRKMSKKSRQEEITANRHKREDFS